MSRFFFSFLTRWDGYQIRLKEERGACSVVRLQLLLEVR